MNRHFWSEYHWNDMSSCLPWLRWELERVLTNAGLACIMSQNMSSYDLWKAHTGFMWLADLSQTIEQVQSFKWVSPRPWVPLNNECINLSSQVSAQSKNKQCELVKAAMTDFFNLCLFLLTALLISDSGFLHLHIVDSLDCWAVYHTHYINVTFISLTPPSHQKRPWKHKRKSCGSGCTNLINFPISHWKILWIVKNLLLFLQL